MGTKRRRVAIERIDSRAAQNVCFSKRRKGLFKKAEELMRLDPDVSVHALVFSPAGTPFIFGDPSFFSSLPDLLQHRPDETGTRHLDEQTRALLAVDISTLNHAERRSYAERLRQLRSVLMSNTTVANQNQNQDVSLVVPAVDNVPFEPNTATFDDSSLAGIDFGFGFDFDSDCGFDFDCDMHALCNM